MKEKLSTVLTLILLPGLALGLSPLQWALYGMKQWPKPAETWAAVKQIPRGYFEIIEAIWPPRIYSQFEWGLLLLWETWHFVLMASIPLLLLIVLGKFLQSCNNSQIFGQIINYALIMAIMGWGLSLT